jgi:hypothetical protein
MGKDSCKIPANKLSDDVLKKKQKKAPGPSLKKGVKDLKSKKEDEEKSL